MEDEYYGLRAAHRRAIQEADRHMPLHGSEVVSPGSLFARFNPGRYTVLPREVAHVMMRRRVGVNDWFVMLALCGRIYADSELNTYGREANADSTLIPAFGVSIYRNAVSVDLGAFTNDAPPVRRFPRLPCRPRRPTRTMGTTRPFRRFGDLVDTVSYTGLMPGKKCTLTGALVDKETGELVLPETPETPRAADARRQAPADGRRASGCEYLRPGCGGLRRLRHRHRVQHQLTSL